VKSSGQKTVDEVPTTNLPPCSSSRVIPGQLVRLPWNCPGVPHEESRGIWQKVSRIGVAAQAPRLEAVVDANLDTLATALYGDRTLRPDR
jgi:hypothetical protein